MQRVDLILLNANSLDYDFKIWKYFEIGF